MPELPEVESLRRSLEPRLLGRVVRAVALHRRDIAVGPGDPFGGIARQRGAAGAQARQRRIPPEDLLLGATIVAVRRHGKQLALVGRTESAGIACDLALGIQLGMSGQLIHRAAGQRVPETNHIHATWRFDDGRLVFRDPRRFGGLRIFPSLAALKQHWGGLGPDALALTTDQLAGALSAARRPIKAALLDQSLIAGIGNIYADEALFAAAIRPRRRCDSLRPVEVAELARTIVATLSHAISAGGSTLRDYVDADGAPGSYQLDHSVYGRGGLRCHRCGKSLSSALVAQRTTVWCAHCQH